jgi:3-keto-L-gulonate-6-phosphate decarboxylase
MKPLLQIAIDSISKENIRIIVQDAIACGIDIIEIGNPGIIVHGLGLIRDLKRDYPDITFYADIKSIDFSFIETAQCFNYGAKYATVLTTSNDDNIKCALETADNYGCEIVFSTMGHPRLDLPNRVMKIKEFGGKYFIAHGSGNSLSTAYSDLMKTIKCIKSCELPNIIFAGGITYDKVAALCSRNPFALIIGRGICETKNYKETIFKIKSIINEFQ